ncbi:MAG: phenylalanine--tRNA ligase subunit alpha [Actinobacteria bacterium RBG_16_68_21]|nr:MAG: phenylalanine--tRNA ligase subunit alpha [Actinobacteria bacterium RBG_16_68_21]
MIPREDLRAHASAILYRIGAAATVAEVDRLQDEALGESSPITAARRSLREATPDQKRALGAIVNEVTTTLADALAARRSVLAEEERIVRLAAERVDMTLPGYRPERGAAHLVMQVWDEIVDIFTGIGYTVAAGPEVETAYYNFDALNTPATHPARLESDTLYVDYGDDPEGVLLRTQTSPVQARWMESHQPPVHIIVPGRVYRRDAVDATHTPVFHQMEALAVGEDITFADLRGTLAYFMDQFFGKHTRQRFLPNFFPFTEPSAEMHVSCHRCDGSGCRTCGNRGWIELLGCGVVDPNVLEAAGYDAGRVSGWAFGVGIDRLAMIRHDIPELRFFFDADLRVLEQFR